MRTPRAAILALVGLLALGLSASPVGGRAPQPVSLAAVPEAAAPLPQLQTVRMGAILGLATTPFYLAKERGYLAAEGIDLQYEPVQVTAESIAQLAAGNLEVANVTLGAAVLNSLTRGIDIRIISGNDGFPPAGPGGNPMLVRKDLYDQGVTDATGLRGRKVAGNSLAVFTEYAIDQALRTGGLTIDDVEFVPIPFADIPAALANNVVEAAFDTEPSATVAITQGSAVRIIPEFARGAQQTVLMAGPNLLREPALAAGFLRAFLRGVRDAQAEGFTPDNAALVEQYTRVPAALVQQVGLPYWDPDGRVNWDSLMDQQRFYMARGEVNYSEPLDLLHLLSEDGPRQAAVASLNR